jgi:protein-serine/threonine kinase
MGPREFSVPSDIVSNMVTAESSSVKKKPRPYLKRFEELPNGTHEHRLKCTKLEKTLFETCRDLLGGKKGINKSSDWQASSRLLNWTDLLREREKLVSDAQRASNATETLVEKYGECKEIIGRGATATVRISHKKDPKAGKVEQLYAVKKFRRKPQESMETHQKRLISEFCISSSLRHPNVIYTIDLLQDEKGNYCEVMEFCTGGDLYTLVLTAGKLEIGEAECYFKQLIRGVEYLHEMGVAHLDLKPQNIVLTVHGSLRITDFGNAECFRMAWEKEARMTIGRCGTPSYISPEQYLDEEFDPKAADVWATGVIYIAMRKGRLFWGVAKKEDEYFRKYLEDRKHEGSYRPIENLHSVSHQVYSRIYAERD